MCYYYYYYYDYDYYDYDSMEPFQEFMDFPQNSLKSSFVESLTDYWVTNLIFVQFHTLSIKQTTDKPFDLTVTFYITVGLLVTFPGYEQAFSLLSLSSKP